MREVLTVLNNNSYNCAMKFVFGVMLLLLVALQYRLWVGEGSLANIARLKQEIEVQKQENQRLEHINNQLANEVDALRNGYEAIEAKAREELGLVKKGETYFFFVDEE